MNVNKQTIKEKMQSTKGSMNRDDRRTLKKKMAPIARRVVELEKNIKNNINKEESEREITEIMGSLSMVEMIALEDYIYSKNLLDNH